MSSLPRGKAAYKKKDGILTLSEDRKHVTWTPLPGSGPPVVSLAVANVTNLQQTPDTAPKVMLKIFEKLPDAEGEPVSYLFHFNSPTDARPEANAVKDMLSRLLTDVRTSDPSLPKPAAAVSTATNGAGASAAMSFASTVNSKSGPAPWFDDNHLKMDIELQQSLMKKDKGLHQTYMEARETKPDNISDAAFNSQFWSTRTNVLRAHAIEINQKKGSYNVLSTVKPEKNAEGNLTLKINVAEVQMIFNQHPLVKRIYNENVPKVPESQFWSRFFLSKLAKRLKGERVSDNDNPDPLFDKYDPAENTTAFTSKITSQHVPSFIDLEANEENQGGVKSGNRKDVEMRPRSNIPIVKALNSLSEKLMVNVAPSDQDPTDVSGVDDQAFQELSLRDLRGDAQEHRIMLNVKEQSRFFSDQASTSSANAQVYAKQVPSEVLFDVQSDLETLEDDGSGGIDLRTGLGVDDDSDSDEEVQKAPHVGSRAARKTAQSQILEGLAQRRAELYGHSSDETSPMGIPPEVTQKAYITNATTTEFLKQFWNAFLSGDPDRAQELAYHVESLRKSTQRIEAVADDAEAARHRTIEQKKEQIRAHFKQTGNKIRWKPDSVGGGKKAVLTLLSPTLNALKVAQNMYQAALAAEGIAVSTEHE